MLLCVRRVIYAKIRMARHGEIDLVLFVTRLFMVKVVDGTKK